MTPQSPTPHRRVPVRRPAAALAAVVVIASMPLVARALSDEPAAPTAADVAEVVSETATRQDPSPAPRPTPPVAATDPSPEPEPEPEFVVDPVIVLLADTYDWDERSQRIELLQATLGVEPDGRYGRATHQAHRNAMEFVGLPTDTLPVPALPPGPSESEWEALRQCESNGNYAITNPSGKYRGAYQFDRTTWDSVASRHGPHLVGVDPAAAAPADQDAMARALYSERGAQPWPQCGRHLS